MRFSRMVNPSGLFLFFFADQCKQIQKVFHLYIDNIYFYFNKIRVYGQELTTVGVTPIFAIKLIKWSSICLWAAQLSPYNANRNFIMPQDY